MRNKEAVIRNLDKLENIVYKNKDYFITIS